MKKLSLKIIISLFTFSIGISAVVFWFYNNQREFIETNSVSVIDNSHYINKSECYPGLSREISKIQKTSRGYFPFPTWKAYHNKYDVNYEEYKSDDLMNAIRNDWFGSQLKAMKEKSLLEVSTEDIEVYRFLWLRSFDHPIFVRVEKRGNSIQLFSKEMDGNGGYNPGKVFRKVNKTLDVTQWNEFLSLLEKSRYWQLPSDIGVMGRDGSNWILEGVKDNRYHLVDRWTPESGEYREACIYLLKLSEVDVDGLKSNLY